jgi:hypothetical protein
MYLADLRGTDQCWLHGGSGSLVAFSSSFVRSLVYVFYMTGGPRDLMPYIPTVNNRAPLLLFVLKLLNKLIRERN